MPPHKNTLKHTFLSIFTLFIAISILQLSIKTSLNPTQSMIYAGSWWGPITSFFSAGPQIENLGFLVALFFLGKGLLAQRHYMYITLLSVWSFICTQISLSIMDLSVSGPYILCTAFLTASIPGLFKTKSGKNAILIGSLIYIALILYPRTNLESLSFTIQMFITLVITWFYSLDWTRRFLIWILLPTLISTTLISYGFPWRDSYHIQIIENSVEKKDYKNASKLLNEFLAQNPKSIQLIALAKLEATGQFPLAPRFGEELLLTHQNQLSAQYALAEIWLGQFPQTEAKHDLILKQWQHIQEPNPGIQNILAMIYCSSRDSTLQNPKKGLELSNDANQTTNWEFPEFLDTHAACMQANNLQSQALKWSKVASDQMALKCDTTKSDSLALKSIQKNHELILQNKRVLY